MNTATRLARREFLEATALVGLGAALRPGLACGEVAARGQTRGQSKIRLRCSLALLVMLAMAVGRVRQKRRDKLRSLVAT